MITDDSIITFGTHRGKRMEDIPASYLLWLWDNGVARESGDLHDYIARSFTALCQECPDYIPKLIPGKDVRGDQSAIRNPKSATP